MIKVEEVSVKDEKEFGGTRIRLMVDGEVVQESKVSAWKSRPGRSASTLDWEASERFLGETFNSLGEHFSELCLKLHDGWPAYIQSASIEYCDNDGNETGLIAFEIFPPLAHWTRPWSYAQYYAGLEHELKNSNVAGVGMGGQDVMMRMSQMGLFGLIFSEFPKDKPLCQVFEYFKGQISRWHEAVEQTLTAGLNRGSLVTFFEFPASIKVACEQYLQYFVQFLEDLGIEADSEIRSDAGRVLFAVTPRSGEEALSAIQEALAAYLQLSRSDNISGQELAGGDMAIHQLRANILHLQGQLATAQALIQLSQATVQAKNETISAQALQLVMYQSGQIIQNPALPAPAQSGAEQKSNDEPIFGGAVKITPLKMKGVEVDLPQILRKLRRRLSNKE